MPKMSKLFYNHTLTLLYQHRYFIKSTKQSKCSVCVYECISKKKRRWPRETKENQITNETNLHVDKFQKSLEELTLRSNNIYFNELLDILVKLFQ